MTLPPDSTPYLLSDTPTLSKNSVEGVYTVHENA